MSVLPLDWRWGITNRHFPKLEIGIAEAFRIVCLHVLFLGTEKLIFNCNSSPPCGRLSLFRL